MNKRIRQKAKKEISEAIDQLLNKNQLDKDELFSQEIDESFYCYMYGPCKRCLDKEEKD